MKLCKEDGCTAEVIGDRVARCPDCHRKYKREKARERRAKKRKQLISSNPELEKSGFKICSKCFKKRHLSEYAVRHPKGKHGEGKRNKICDVCLTSIYSGAERFALGVVGSNSFWRKKGYSCNTAAAACRSHDSVE